MKYVVTALIGGLAGVVLMAVVNRVPALRSIVNS
jgi:hypothetical protein